MRYVIIPTLIVFMSVLAMTGCVTTNSNVPASTGVGAAAGALLGYGLTGKGTGAAAGAGAGMLAGALTGVVLDESQRRRVQASPPPQSYHDPSPRYRSASVAYATQPDPTTGQIFNNTSWRLEVLIDDAPSPLYLSPRQSYPINLDIGNHQVVAKAYVSTKFGERAVGTHTRTIYVDPRNSGWSLRMDETMF